MSKYIVEFLSGQSLNGESPVDYMQTFVLENDIRGSDVVHLYAERSAIPGDEMANFIRLKEDILEQAEEAGIAPDRLFFSDFN